MRKPTLATTLCVAAMLLGLAAAAEAEPAARTRFDQPIDFDAVDRDLLARAIVRETNFQRVAHDLPPFPTDARLGEMAMRHAGRMAELGFYDHFDPFDPALNSPDQRAAAVGIGNPFIAENIHDLRAIQSDGGPVYPLGERGKFSVDPDGAAIPPHTYASFATLVVQEWMDSPGHRRNILSADGRAIGVGVAFYWRDGDWPFFKTVQDFQEYEDVRADGEVVPTEVEPPPAQPTEVTVPVEPSERPAPVDDGRGWLDAGGCHHAERAARPVRHARGPRRRARARTYRFVDHGVIWTVRVDARRFDR